MATRQSAALERKKLLADPIMVTTIVVLIAFLTLFILYPLAMLLMDSVHVSETKMFTLEEICDTFRLFAASRMGLYYEKKVISLLFAGLASTKLILLQGISGTGKTSLPYALGKFIEFDMHQKCCLHFAHLLSKISLIECSIRKSLNIILKVNTSWLARHRNNCCER